MLGSQTELLPAELNAWDSFILWSMPQSCVFNFFLQLPCVFFCCFVFKKKKSNVNHSVYSVTMIYDLQPVHLNTGMLHEPGLWDDGGGEMGRLEWDIQNQAK
ncbi:hypothetical protein KIL84_006632 [Mauremys mutica]|uniref:Uncharacterized protein n=1 Tax=Mauremys mutica TaxID=74926 RepID=A0A9D4AUR1_9SAUR|nr:hypothetical protein KIL84_006632 [Mauremys mutica]